MTYLTEQLPFASGSSTNHALPPPRSHLLVTDTQAAPAHFVLYHLISAAVLDKRKVCLNPRIGLSVLRVSLISIDRMGRYQGRRSDESRDSTQKSCMSFRSSMVCFILMLVGYDNTFKWFQIVLHYLTIIPTLRTYRLSRFVRGRWASVTEGYLRSYPKRPRRRINSSFDHPGWIGGINVHGIRACPYTAVCPSYTRHNS